MTFFRIAVLACVAMLTACASTGDNTVVISEQEQQLQQAVVQYPKDTQALRELVDYQLKRFDEAPDSDLLERVQGNLEKGIALAPTDRYFAYHYYLLNIKVAFVERQYDLEKWQAFYPQHPFLATLDLAPPVFIPYLLGQTDEANQLETLKQSVKDNPYFMNAYVDLAYHYYLDDKLQLAMFVTQSALKRNEKFAPALSDWLHYKVTYLHDKMCTADISEDLEAITSDARRLTYLDSENALYHDQLAEIFKLSGKYPLGTFSALKAEKLDPTEHAVVLGMYLWDGKIDKVLNDPQTDLSNIDVDSLLTLIYTHIAAGNWAQAATLADQFITMGDASIYGVLYGAFAYGMQGNETAKNALLKKAGDIFQPEDWHAHMLDFARGTIDEAQLFALSEDKCNQSEALFIAALQRLENNDDATADDYFKQVVDLDIKAFYEYAVARYRVKK